ncbi:MAG: hypothetical protein HY960_00125 [Ignavibacteriae bacterium]|nr:hypothetical protein [Ignavibacteriota bacterium]
MSLVSESFEDIIKDDFIMKLDIDNICLIEKLEVTIPFTSGGKLTIREKYEFEKFRLSIAYHYSYRDSNGRQVISFDNAPHHKHLTTFPHHKHYYPKNRYEPMNFDGDIVIALQEILWIIDNL